MEQITETKFCIKCMHYRHKGKSHLCASQKTTVLDMVTGEYHEENLVDCSKMRKEGSCGEHAILFNKKLTYEK